MKYYSSFNFLNHKKNVKLFLDCKLYKHRLQTGFGHSLLTLVQNKITENLS